jgi:hypothetical protein
MNLDADQALGSTVDPVIIAVFFQPLMVDRPQLCMDPTDLNSRSPSDFTLYLNGVLTANHDAGEARIGSPGIIPWRCLRPRSPGTLARRV